MDDRLTDLSEILIANSCNPVPRDKFARDYKRYTRTRHTSERLADRLELLGIDAFQQGQDITRIGLITGVEKQADRPFRHINIIPSVMESDRKHLIRSLTFWLENDFSERARYLRYAVITCENVPFHGDVKATHTRWARKVSDLFRGLQRRFGILLQLRTTEITVNSDSNTINLHMNVLYELRKIISNRVGGWNAVTSLMRQRLQCRVYDAGIVQSSRKAGNYLLKSFDVSALDNEPLAWLAGEMLGLRLVQRYNDFRAFSADLAEQRHRIVFHHDKRKLVKVRKRKVRDNSPMLFEGDDEFEKYAYVTDEQTAKSNRKSKKEPEPRFNEIVGVMMPHCFCINLTEPVLIVRNRDKREQSEIAYVKSLYIQKIARKIRALPNVDFIGTPESIPLDQRHILKDGLFDADYILDSINNNSQSPLPPVNPLGGAGGSATLLPDMKSSIIRVRPIHQISRFKRLSANAARHVPGLVPQVMSR